MDIQHRQRNEVFVMAWYVRVGVAIVWGSISPRHRSVCRFGGEEWSCELLFQVAELTEQRITCAVAVKVPCSY